MLKRKTNDYRGRRLAPAIMVLIGLLMAAPGEAWAQDRGAARAGFGDEAGGGAFYASRLLGTARELLEANQNERGVKLLETIIEQYPDLDVRYEALLALGKHHLDQRDQPKAVHYLNQVRPLGQRDPLPTGDLLETYLEALYRIGVANFQMQRYAAAFPVLRKITEEFPNTVWANQAYYYIGLCHFAQERWQQAIDALSLVGTFVDPGSESIQYVEAGQRFYIKVEDMDLPVLDRLGRTVRLRIEASSGDKAMTELMALARDEGVFIASVPTEVGVPVDETKLEKPTAAVLQVIGGDELTVYYIDGNTPEGKKDVMRQTQVRVVSSAKLRYTLGTFEDPASVAYLDQPLFIKLDDADVDSGPGRDAATVRVISRYKADDDLANGERFNAETAAMETEDDQEWIVRDELDLHLEELGDAPVRSGEFGGKVHVHRAVGEANKTDDRLTAERGDQIVVSFLDERHINGTSPRQVTRAITVVGEIDASPRVTQNVVPDVVLKAKKNIVEATAYLELARIFRSMGLLDDAAEKAREGLDRVDEIVMTPAAVPDDQRQEAFRLRWELYLVQDDFAQAVATCRLFNQLYPDSPFVDQALLGIARTKLEQDEFGGARAIYEQILKLENSQVKAQAQYQLALTVELEAEARAKAEAARRGQDAPKNVISESAIKAYRQCAQKYPDSEYAGLALAKVIDYYIANKDYIRAEDLLNQVFQDYPDAEFLDAMLARWVKVAINMGNLQKAYDKASDLLFQYPQSKYAAQAKELLPKLQAALNQ